MEQLEKQLDSLEKAVNCLRKEIEDFKSKIINEVTDFKRDIAERFASHKYEVSESISKSAFACKTENNQALSTLSTTLTTAIDKQNLELSKRITEVKVEAKEQLQDEKKNLTDVIRSRVKYVAVTTGVLMAAMSWLWTYSYRTQERVDTFRQEIRQELSLFKDELKSMLVEDIKITLFKLEARQDQLLYLLSQHDKTSPQDVDRILKNKPTEKSKK